MRTSTSRSANWSVERLAWMAMLIAMSVALNFFSFGTSFLQLKFVFFATALMGYYLGPIQAGLAGFLADFFMNLGSGFPYFPPYAVTAIFSAAVYGIFLYRKPVRLWRVFAAVTIVIFIANILLGTWWLDMLGTPWQSVIAVRTVKNLVMWPIQTAMIFVSLRAVERIRPAR